MDTTSCPECGAPAEVQWRSVLEGTDGPVEHAKVLCVRRHWFLLPVAHLARPADQTSVLRISWAETSLPGPVGEMRERKSDV